MCKCLVSLCICLLLSTYASAETIVRHEHSARRAASSEPTTSAEVVDSYSPVEVVDSSAGERDADDVLVVYGPLKEPALDAPENNGVVAGEEIGENRVDKFLGDYSGKDNPGLRRGKDNGVDYVDSIYLLGTDAGREDYVIALRKQLEHEKRQATYVSFIMLMGRGAKDGVVFETDKLPQLELLNNGVEKIVSFEHAWVKQPWGFMLRMNSEIMTETLNADMVNLLFGTSVGTKKILIPKPVIDQWKVVGNLQK